MGGQNFQFTTGWQLGQTVYAAYAQVPPSKHFPIPVVSETGCFIVGVDRKKAEILPLKLFEEK